MGKALCDLNRLYRNQYTLCIGRMHHLKKRPRLSYTRLHDLAKRDEGDEGKRATYLGSSATNEFKYCLYMDVALEGE